MTEMTIEELTEIATEFLRENYDMHLMVPIKRNNRFKNVMGRYNFTNEEEPLDIELAGFMFDYADDAVLIDTLKHELIHLALHVRGEPYDDGHPHFEAELRKHGVSSTRINYVGKQAVCKCVACDDEWETSNRNVMKRPHSYVTLCCRAELQIVGEHIYNGTEAIS